MESFFEKAQGFFNLENIKHLWSRLYEWFEITLVTLFGKIPFTPVRDLFVNPWFWFIIIFIIIVFSIFRRR